MASNAKASSSSSGASLSASQSQWGSQSLADALAEVDRVLNGTCTKAAASASASISISDLAARVERENSYGTDGGGVEDEGTDSIPKCCCGKPDCAFLAHSCTLLEGLERDVQTAARMGQALLVRHESYMADSTRERAQLSESVISLEHDKHLLEAQNTATIAENRSLLDQLERLNSSAAEADARARSLTSELSTTREQLARALARAKACEELERQVEALERDQAGLVEVCDGVRQDERGAIYRWRQAERTISELGDQIERMERESKTERERHVEVISRMERRRAVEKELEGAAGRLKGAAAAKRMAAQGGRTEGPHNVVGHFVNDILQDNTNLQMGIVELRELLQNTNDEVERLRDRLTHHQPVEEDGLRSPGQAPSTPQTLQSELSVMASPANPELHVHHHYHAPASPSRRGSGAASPRPKPHLQRKASRRKRNIITPGLFTPLHAESHPSSPGGRSITTERQPTIEESPSSLPSASTSALAAPSQSSAAATILSQTTVSLPHNRQTLHHPRWSVQSGVSSATTMDSSGPASPTSTSYPASGMFDRVFSDAGGESSLPTSPEESDAGSPILAPVRARDALAKAGYRAFSAPMAFQPRSVPTNAFARPPRPSRVMARQSNSNDVFTSPDTEHSLAKELNSAMEDTLDLSEVQASAVSRPEGDGVTTPTAAPDESPDFTHNDTPTQNDPYFSTNTISRRGLHRSSSHDSLISLSGMDIHLSQSQLSPALSATTFFSGTPISTSTSTTSITPAHAPHVPGRITRAQGGRSQAALSDLATISTSTNANNAHRPLHRLPSQPHIRGTAGVNNDQHRQPALKHWTSQKALRQVGGWVLGRWGVGAASPSTSSTSIFDPSASIDAMHDTALPPPVPSLPAAYASPSAPSHPHSPSPNPNTSNQTASSKERDRALMPPPPPPPTTTNPSSTTSTSTSKPTPLGLPSPTLAPIPTPKPSLPLPKRTTTPQILSPVGTPHFIAMNNSKSRNPGINQPGAIFGLGPEAPAPYRAVVDAESGGLDLGALREGLEGGGGEEGAP